MRFGINTQTRGPLATRNAYMAMADIGERYAYDFISVNDHVVIPAAISSHYPYSEEGSWSGAASGFCLDQLATLSFLAGCTRSLRLLTSVMVVPHRPAVLTAKMLATADVLSQGRLILGVGAGWLKEEFDILGAPYAGRGRATDEYIEAFKVLWRDDRPVYNGDFVKFDNVKFEPKPVQKPHPPIWVGGESDAAMRRVVRHCDAWYPGSNNPARRLDTPARLKAAIGDLHAMSEKAGRDPATIDVALTVQWPVSWEAQKATDGSRRVFTGSAADMAQDTAALAGLGVSHVSLQLGTDSLEETCARIQRFGEEVQPLVRAKS
ncbi:MAG: LLM class F420-dependent oxidoreductase [Hyphomicrobiaceae bacterium]